MGGLILLCKIALLGAAFVGVVCAGYWYQEQILH